MKYIKELNKDNAKDYFLAYIKDRPNRLNKFKTFLLKKDLITEQEFNKFTIDSFINIFIACSPLAEIIFDSSKVPDYDSIEDKPIWFYIERWSLGDENDGWSLESIPIIDGLWVYLEETILKNMNWKYFDINPVNYPIKQDLYKPTIHPDNIFESGIYILNPIIINLYAYLTRSDYDPKKEFYITWESWSEREEQSEEDKRLRDAIKKRFSS